MKDIQTITRKDITSLLGHTAPGGVLSVYVGLSSTERHDPGRWLSAVRSGLKELVQRHPGEKGLATLVETAQEEIGRLPVESRRRSLAYFRSLDPDWSFTRSLHPFLHDLFAFAPAPQVARLVSLLDETPCVGVAVLSQDHVRPFTWKDGVVEELEEIRADEEHVAPTGEGLSKSAVPPNRAEDRVRRSVLRAAQKLSRVSDAQRWQKVLLFGIPPALPILTEALSDATRRILIPAVERNLINAPLGEIALAASQAIHDWKRKDELSEVERVLEDARSGGRAAAGIEICLERLHQGNIERFYVNSDLEASGFRDPNGRLYVHAPVVPAGSNLHLEDRLIEKMVSQALEIGAVVVPLEGDSARRLSLMGGVAARLRWREAGANGR
jgi:hypothetical protein